jgi:hypothetical protein
VFHSTLATACDERCNNLLFSEEKNRTLENIFVVQLQAACRALAWGLAPTNFDCQSVLLHLPGQNVSDMLKAKKN